MYVYDERGGSHHLPHCHVRHGAEDTVLVLPTLMRLAGPDLPRAVRKLVESRLEDIVAAWATHNPDGESNG